MKQTISEANSSPDKYRLNYILSFTHQTDVILDQMVLEKPNHYPLHLILLKSFDPRSNKFYLVYLEVELHEIYSGFRAKPSTLSHFVLEMPKLITSGCFYVDKLGNPEDPQVEILLQMDNCVLKIPGFSHLMDYKSINLAKLIDGSSLVRSLFNDKYALNLADCKIDKASLDEEEEENPCLMFSMTNASQLSAGQRGLNSILNGRKLIIFEFEE